MLEPSLPAAVSVRQGAWSSKSAARRNASRLKFRPIIRPGKRAASPFGRSIGGSSRRPDPFGLCPRSRSSMSSGFLLPGRHRLVHQNRNSLFTKPIPFANSRKGVCALCPCAARYELLKINKWQSDSFSSKLIGKDESGGSLVDRTRLDRKLLHGSVDPLLSSVLQP